MKIYIDTLGCPKNFNDSEVAAGLLEKAGHAITDDPGQADAVIVNTCGFINDAKQESIDRIFQMAQLNKILVVSGCLSQRYGEELWKEMPEADIIVGVNDYEKLAQMLSDHEAGHREKSISEYQEASDVRGNEDDLPRKLPAGAWTATLKIAEGCNNRCTYCVIPYIRGPYRSRSMEAVIREAEQLARLGIRELILIAQDTTAWGQDIYGEYRLPELLRKLCRIDGLRWIRLMYCYEDRITDDLINVIAEEPKICNYLDIPLQHGSDRILAAMDRRSTRNSIEAKIGRLREAIPDIHIRTTLITGFPGETEDDFDQLTDMVEKLRFERLGVFAYSAEEGTPAAAMENQIDQQVREERRDSIMRRQLDISLAKNREKIGSRLEVLLEEEDEDGSWAGRTEYDAPEIDCSVLVAADREHKPGDMITVLIEDAFDYDLIGKEI